MNESPITIEKVHLQGFRAYLQPQTFDLSPSRKLNSLAVFASNAKGKSSFVDSFEFYFSKDSTLKRLGKLKAQTHAGPAALKHVDSEQRGIQPAVHFWFKQGGCRFDERRSISEPLPEVAGKVLSKTRVPFIIRGHELRAFVEEKTPGAQYKDLVVWFALDPLLAIQQNLRSLRRRLKERLDSDSQEQERSRDLSVLTNNQITTYDERGLCEWLNVQVLAHLDASLNMSVLSDQDPAFQGLVQKEAVELQQIGIASLKKLLGHVEDLIATPEAGPGNRHGLIPQFEEALSCLKKATAQADKEKSIASNAVFSKVWTKAKELFQSNVDFDACPICDTRFSSSPLGSRDLVQNTLDDKLAELKRYREAEIYLEKTQSALIEISSKLKNGLETAAASLEDAGRDCDALLAYSENLSSWIIGDEVPDCTSVVQALYGEHSSVSAKVNRIEQQQGEHSYSKALEKAKRLLSITSDLKRISRTKIELQSLLEELSRQTHLVDEAIVKHIATLIRKLQEEVNTIYGEIQGGTGDIPPISLALPDQDDKDQQRAQLLIDFSGNRKGVIPSGYLSDSQLHTLALAIRLSAIRMFNSRFPTIVLDDVVTSYDVDHRKTIAAVLGKHFPDFQIVIVTHDEQFFNILRDQLPQGRWAFKRIKNLRPGFGPVFDDYRTPDQLIEVKLMAGESASAEMRTAEEEWLHKICREFGTSTVIRTAGHEFSYTRSELADSLAQFLKKAKISPPKVPGNANPFLQSIQQGVVENLASHFSDNPHRVASVGDDKKRWEEFKYFRDQFVCPSCNRSRFRRPFDVDKPLCNFCQQPFSFQHSVESST